MRTVFRPGKCRYSQTDNDGRGEAGLSMNKHQETGELNKGGRNHFVTWCIPINSLEAEKEKGRRGICFFSALFPVMVQASETKSSFPGCATFPTVLALCVT